MATIHEVKEKVQRYLTANFHGVMVDSDGDWSFRVSSARVFVGVAEWIDHQVVVRVFSQFLMDVPVTQELKDYLALEAGRWPFGCITTQVRGDKATLILRHELLGDYLDEAELVNACTAVGAVAENLDDELQARFGGVKFHEDSPRVPPPRVPPEI